MTGQQPPSPLAIGEFDTGYAERRPDGVWAVCELRDCTWEHRCRDVQGAAKAVTGHKRHKYDVEEAS